MEWDDKPKDADKFGWREFVAFAMANGIESNPNDYGHWWNCWKSAYEIGKYGTALFSKHGIVSYDTNDYLERKAKEFLILIYQITQTEPLIENHGVNLGKVKEFILSILIDRDKEKK